MAKLLYSVEVKVSNFLKFRAKIFVRDLKSYNLAFTEDDRLAGKIRI